MALRFRSDRTFTIVQLTDVHWRNGEPGARVEQAEHEPEAWARSA